MRCSDSWQLFLSAFYKSYNKVTRKLQRLQQKYTFLATLFLIFFVRWFSVWSLCNQGFIVYNNIYTIYIYTLLTQIHWPTSGDFLLLWPFAKLRGYKNTATHKRLLLTFILRGRGIATLGCCCIRVFLYIFEKDNKYNHLQREKCRRAFVRVAALL